MKKEEVETPLESICLQFKVSQPFYFHILAGTEESCITNCYFKNRQDRIHITSGEMSGWASILSAMNIRDNTIDFKEVVV